MVLILFSESGLFFCTVWRRMWECCEVVHDCGMF